jgi:hypothetical protein
MNCFQVLRASIRTELTSILTIGRTKEYKNQLVKSTKLIVWLSITIAEEILTNSKGL